MAGRALTIDITTRDQQTLAALKRIQRELGQLDKSVDATAKNSDKLGQSAEDFAQRLGEARATAGTITLGATVAVLGAATMAAGNLAEAQAKTNSVFGESVGVINEFADGATEALALSKREALEASSTFGNLFTQLGVGTGQAAEMSKAMITLGGDFAAFHNANPVEVIEAQTAAFRGEYDALQRFVPTINAAAVEQQALAETGKASARELTAQEKALATYTIMLENAGDAQGAAARESDGLAMSTKRAKAELENAGAEMGESLVPIAAKGASAIADLAGVFAMLPGPVQTGTIGIGGLALGVGLLAPKIGETVGVAKAGIEAVRNLGSESATTGQKMAGAATGAAALTGAVMAGVAAWQQWGAQGAEAADEWASKFEQANGLTAEGFRQSAKDLRAFDEGLEGSMGLVDRFGQNPVDLGKSLFNIDAERAEDEAKKVAEARAAALDAAADKIDEVAERTGRSSGEVAEAIQSMGLDVFSLSADDLAQALGRADREQASAARSAADMAEASKSAADQMAEEADAARDVFAARQSLASATEGVADAHDAVRDAQAGVSDAQDAVRDAHKGVEDAARGVADAERGVADAHEALSEASADLAQAQWDQANGTKELKQANQGVEDAEKDLAQAQRDSQTAQEDLTRAREAAAEQLEDMAVSAQKAALDERDALLDLKEMKEEIAKGPDIDRGDGDETDDQRAAREKRNAEARKEWAADAERRQIRLERLEIALAEAQERKLETAEELQEADLKGVEGSELVVGAKEAIVEAAENEKAAQEGLVEAQERVTEVQEELAARVVEAQKRVKDAQDGVAEAALRVRDAHDQVAEAQQRVVDARAGVVEARGAVEEAERGVAEALWAVVQAQGELDTKTLGAEEATRRNIERMREFALTLDPANPLRQNILGLIGDLEAAAGDWDVNLHYRTIYEDVGAAPPGFNKAESFERAVGGRIGAGQRTWVGEKGPELLEMDAPGRVFTPDQMAVEDRRRAALAERDRRRAQRNGGTGGLNARDVTINQTIVEAANSRATATAAAAEVRDALAGMVN